MKVKILIKKNGKWYLSIMMPLLPLPQDGMGSGTIERVSNVEPWGMGWYMPI
jgi:hypothetical protein